MPLRTRRPRRQRVPFLAILVEVALIVFSLLLAFGINEWREGRAQAELAEAALVSIRQEVQRNQRIMQRRYPYHAAALDSMQRYMPELSSDVNIESLDQNRLGFSQGGRFLNPYSSAWRTAQSSGALSYVDYDLLALLGAIYESQSLLQAHDQRVLDVLLTPESMKAGTMYYALGLAAGGLMQDVVGTEADLLILYEPFLERTEHLADRTDTSGVAPDSL